MATTSSNKMPLLVDRPLHSYATIGGTAALNTSTKFNDINSAGCNLIVDCTSNDGAVIDSISVIANETTLTAHSVLIFLSVAASRSAITTINTVCVASGVTGSTSVGERTNISLPALSVPVPHLAGPAATMATYPSEVDKKNTGLYVPSGAAIYAGVSTVIASPPGAEVHVFAQGGFF